MREDRDGTPSMRKPLARRVRGFLAQPRQEKALYIEAWLVQGVMRLATLTLPLRWLAPRFGRLQAESRRDLPAEDLPVVHQVSQAIRRAARVSPWKSKCLQQALAAGWMLRRRGLPTTLYLGVAREGTDGLSAHAWLRCGEVVLVGGEERDRFQIVATFADD